MMGKIIGEGRGDPSHSNPHLVRNVLPCAPCGACSSCRALAFSLFYRSSVLALFNCCLNLIEELVRQLSDGYVI